jgi:hypothetical protein
VRAQMNAPMKSCSVAPKTAASVAVAQAAALQAAVSYAAVEVRSSVVLEPAQVAPVCTWAAVEEPSSVAPVAAFLWRAALVVQSRAPPSKAELARSACARPA